MNKKKILFIVEGAAREAQILHNINQVFFKANEEFEFVSLAAEQNIYMLSQILKKDEFETDIVEVIREYSEKAANQLEMQTRNSFQEVYLFFDFDRHTNNLPVDVDMDAALHEMITIFDNETENGKLYISYPMVEALRDIVVQENGCFLRCKVPINKGNIYKNESAHRNIYEQIKKYNRSTWNNIMRYFVSRIECLLFLRQIRVDYMIFRGKVTVDIIHKAQMEQFVEASDSIFILSAFPFFLLEYFDEKFWEESVCV